MSHITTIGAGIYSDLAVALPTATATVSNVEATLKGYFAGTEQLNVGGVAGTGNFVRIQNVREFPSLGVPANIVNVAAYGSKIGKQVAGQPDAPTIEITVNYLPGDWSNAPASLLGAMVGDGTQKCFRFALLNGQPSGYASTSASIGSPLVGTAGSRENSQWFWFGKVEALLINPQLTDANTATLTLSVQSEFYGPFTI